jgi:hypothetical protein
MAARQYQARVKKLLAEIFGADNVRSEWSIRSDAEDGFNDPAAYAPRVDISVGPFNVTTVSVEHDVGTIVEASRHPLIREVLALGLSQNHGDLINNKNPRCLLAVEIEFSGSSKHILGDFTNASMMGLVGVVIGSFKNMRKIERVGQYVRRLRGVKKAPPDLFMNVACLEARNFLALLEKHRSRADRLKLSNNYNI